MGKGFGPKLKYYRLKSKMTQSELSKGIISVSYFSKIEGGSVEPTKEIIGLLCEKLNISPLSIESDKILELCRTWFKHLMQGEKEEATKLYNEIIGNIGDIANTSLINLVEIHKLYYFILTNNKQKAREQFVFLQKSSTNFKGIEIYYWLKFSGSYSFSHLSYNNSLKLYQEAERHLNTDIYFKEEEEKDLFYVIAITASKLRKTHLSLVYASKALDYYRSIYNMIRCAKCHILLGISYQRTNEFEKAIESYQLATTIANNIGDNNVLALCNQNLGKLNSIMNKSEEAIDYFLKSYELRNNKHAFKKIIPISSLMKEYYKIGDINNAKKWLKKGLDFSKSLSPSDSIYVYEFKVYTHLINGFDHTFEKLITTIVLPFLNEKQLDHEKSSYLKILADYYFNNRKYKLAASYYNYANKALSKVHTE